MKELYQKISDKELKKRYGKAESLLNDEEKMERFLQRLEKKLKIIPVAGETLAIVPVMTSLIKRYLKKEYDQIPIGLIIAIISALVYFVSPIDIIPDIIPALGLVDDAGVVLACLKLVQSDIDEYQAWREKNNKIFED